MKRDIKITLNEKELSFLLCAIKEAALFENWGWRDVAERASKSKLNSEKNDICTQFAQYRMRDAKTAKKLIKHLCKQWAKIAPYYEQDRIQDEMFIAITEIERETSVCINLLMREMYNEND